MVSNSAWKASSKSSWRCRRRNAKSFPVHVILSMMRSSCSLNSCLGLHRSISMVTSLRPTAEVRCPSCPCSVETPSKPLKSLELQSVRCSRPPWASRFPRTSTPRAPTCPPYPGGSARRGCNGFKTRRGYYATVKGSRQPFLLFGTTTETTARYRWNERALHVAAHGAIQFVSGLSSTLSLSFRRLRFENLASRCTLSSFNSSGVSMFRRLQALSGSRRTYRTNAEANSSIPTAEPRLSAPLGPDPPNRPADPERGGEVAAARNRSRVLSTWH